MTAAYLINYLPSSFLQFGTPMSFVPAPSSHSLSLRIFGSVCFVHNHSPSRDKLDSRALRCVFIVSYFSPGSSSLLHGEINRHSLDSEATDESLPFINMPSPNTSPNTSSTPPRLSNESDDINRFDKPDLITYSRRTSDEITTLPHLETSNLEADPIAPIIEPDNGNTLDPYLDLPIAIRKGVRSCTNHRISNFVSYNALSPSSLAFVTSLSSVPVPRT
ncbi:hypothetical protein AgCh_021563 [Apium graveolens]